MEQIEKELSEKTIEKQVDFVVENVIDPPKEAKPKKPRTEAQKEAFEKARKKRAENLKKKKDEEHLDEPILVDEEDLECNKIGKPDSAPKGKPRGRPRGAKNKKVMKREPEPTSDRPNYPKPVENPIYQSQDHGFRYQGHQYQNPYPPMAYQPPPQVHNYYYGHQQGAVNQAPAKEFSPQPEPEPSPEPNYITSEEEYDEELDPGYFPPPTPQENLKYRFA